MSARSPYLCALCGAPCREAATGGSQQARDGDIQLLHPYPHPEPPPQPNHQSGKQQQQQQPQQWQQHHHHHHQQQQQQTPRQGQLRRPLGGPQKRPCVCGGCGALHYCCEGHRSRHALLPGGHSREECGRMAAQLGRAAELADLPFPWFRSALSCTRPPVLHAAQAALEAAAGALTAAADRRVVWPGRTTAAATAAPPTASLCALLRALGERAPGADWTAVPASPSTADVHSDRRQAAAGQAEPGGGGGAPGSAARAVIGASAGKEEGDSDRGGGCTAPGCWRRICGCGGGGDGGREDTHDEDAGDWGELQPPLLARRTPVAPPPLPPPLQAPAVAVMSPAAVPRPQPPASTPGEEPEAAGDHAAWARLVWHLPAHLAPPLYRKPHSQASTGPPSDGGGCGGGDGGSGRGLREHGFRPQPPPLDDRCSDLHKVVVGGGVDGGDGWVCSSSVVDWLSYYRWAELPLESPAALLLHFPLTLYGALRLVDELLGGSLLRPPQPSSHLEAAAAAVAALERDPAGSAAAAAPPSLPVTAAEAASGVSVLGPARAVDAVAGEKAGEGKEGEGQAGGGAGPAPPAKRRRVWRFQARGYAEVATKEVEEGGNDDDEEEEEEGEDGCGSRPPRVRSGGQAKLAALPGGVGTPPTDAGREADAAMSTVSACAVAAAAAAEVEAATATAAAAVAAARWRIDVLYLGPQSELDQLDCFAALLPLLAPGLTLRLHMVGPDVPYALHGAVFVYDGGAPPQPLPALPTLATAPSGRRLWAAVGAEDDGCRGGGGGERGDGKIGCLDLGGGALAERAREGAVGSGTAAAAAAVAAGTPPPPPPPPPLPPPLPPLSPPPPALPPLPPPCLEVLLHSCLLHEAEGGWLLGGEEEDTEEGEGDGHSDDENAAGSGEGGGKRQGVGTGVARGGSAGGSPLPGGLSRDLMTGTMTGRGDSGGGGRRGGRGGAERDEAAAVAAPPLLVLAPNAGLPVYMSWLPTLELLLKASKRVGKQQRPVGHHDPPQRPLRERRGVGAGTGAAAAAAGAAAADLGGTGRVAAPGTEQTGQGVDTAVAAAAGSAVPEGESQSCQERRRRRRAPLACIFTAYNEEECVRSCELLEQLYGVRPDVRPAVNPFRQPLWCVARVGNGLPSYSNGFMYGWLAGC